MGAWKTHGHLSPGFEIFWMWLGGCEYVEHHQMCQMDESLCRLSTYFGWCKTMFAGYWMLLNVIDLFFQWLAFVGSLFWFSNANVAFLHDVLLLIEPDEFVLTCARSINILLLSTLNEQISMNKPSKNNNDLVLICFQLPSNIWIYDTNTEKGTKFDDRSSFPLQQLPQLDCTQPISGYHTHNKCNIYISLNPQKSE